MHEARDCSGGFRVPARRRHELDGERRGRSPASDTKELPMTPRSRHECVHFYQATRTWRMGSSARRAGRLLRAAGILVLLVLGRDVARGQAPVEIDLGSVAAPSVTVQTTPG